MTNTTMITVDQAAFMLSRKYPDLVRCRDYWVAHPVDEKTYKQTMTAWVPVWEPANIPQPTPFDLLAWWPEFEADFALIEAADGVRQKRDALLAEIDPLVERAADAGDADREATLRKYRSALRDVPQQRGFPLDVVWPPSPA